MGSYLNPGSAKYRECIESKIYIDKSGLIEYINSCIGTQQKNICVSRPRRFGKSMALNMLAAYYGKGEDTSGIFASLEIGKTASCKKHLNQYDVIMLNMQEFLSRSKNVDEMLEKIQRYVAIELKNSYFEVPYLDTHDFIQVMKDIFVATGCTFIILIDEWDCLFREYKNDAESQKKYLDFLRLWLKDQPYVGLAYMTGILPIKKYGTHSALNMFSEFSMTNPGNMAEYFGFTEKEAEKLCREYQMNFEELKSWYDGYCLNIWGNEQVSVYNPKSVVEAMLNRRFQNYWNRTETYEALKMYIEMNADGLKEAVITMLAGGDVEVNTEKFANDMTTFSGKDDILTLLIHLGYLTYDLNQYSARIPNREVAQEYRNSIEDIGWDEVVRSVDNSRRLLEALWKADGKTVAEGIDRAHQEIAVLQYNNENALSCTIHLAFYAAREFYTLVREMPSGKGFADVCFIPRKLHSDKPAVVVELKWDKDAKGAIAQIKERGYTEALRDYRDNLLLVGINYNKKEKKHSCIIERA